MKLTRAVCVTCTNQCAPSPWDASDDLAWSDGFIYCVRDPQPLALVSINKEPPGWCTRKFEHAVALGMGEDNV